MKKLLLVFVSFLLASTMHAQLSKTITVTAGTLGTALSANELANVTNLTLSGSINAHDFQIMRDEMPLLKKIDLLGVQITEYKGTEGPNYGVLQSYGADTVPMSAFKNKLSLDTVILSSKVTGIGESAFNGCEGLKDITLPNGIHKIENDVFSGCFNLNAITLPSSLSAIGVYSFLGCGLTSISFPSSLTTIGNHSFESTAIKTLTFPNSLQTLDIGAFNSCNYLESVVIPPSITTINEQLFFNCPLLNSITLPNTITTINDYAFEYCTNLKSITLPTSVTSVGPYAFKGCTGLQTFKIPYKTKLNVIGSSAFAGCSSLGSIEIPENMSLIGNLAFVGCSTLTTVKVYDAVPFIFNANDMIFENTILSTCSLNVPTASYSAYGLAEVWKGFYNKKGFSYLKKAITLTKEGELSTILTSAELNDVTDLTISGPIDARDFKTMKNMLSINNIDLSNATIVGYSGPDGPSLGDNVYPVNTIPEYSFSYKSSLENIILPNTATKIDQYAFRGSKASIYISASISDMGTGVFAESSATISIDANNTKFIVEEDVLMNKNKTDLYYCSSSKFGSYTVPSTVTSIHDYCFNGCSDITEINFPKGLIEIGNNAFNACTGISNFNLPESVEKIGAGAFSNCTMVKMVLPPKVSILSWNLLQNCTKLNSVSLPLNATNYGSDMFLNSTSINSLQVYNPVPVDLTSNQNVFDSINVTTCALVVPFESLVAYKDAEVWKTFTSITESSGLRALKKSITVDNHGGNDTIHFASNASWSVTTKASWLNVVSKPSGYGDSLVVFSISPNQGADREAYIYFSVSGTLTDSVKITQKYECTPKPTVFGISTVCLGEKVSLWVYSTNKLEWFNDVALTNKIATSTTYDLTPTANSSLYVVESSSANCSSPAYKVDIVVNALPTVSATVSNNDVCPNTELIFTGSSSYQLTYKWSNPITNNVPYTVSKSTIYTVTGTDVKGCKASSSISIVVKSSPTIIAIASKPTICLGDSIALNGQGGKSYIWDQGVTNNVLFSPKQSDYYIVTGTDINGCIGVNSFYVVVNPLPTISTTVSINDVCPNTEITFKAASTYSMSYAWSDAVNNNVPYTVSSTKTYYVTGTDLNGCKTSSSINVIVKPFPSITAIASKPTLCQGKKLTLNGQGGLSYDWNNNVTDNISFTPSQTNWYYVTGTDVDGCKNTASVEVLVYSLPTISTSVSINDVCPNTEITFKAASTYSMSYAWSDAVNNNVPYTVSSTKTYYVTGTDLNGCKTSSSINVIVKPFPSITAIASKPTLCQGEKLTLNGQGGLSYDWNNNVTDNISFTPSQTNWYYVTGTDVDGCKNTASVEVLVYSLPTISTSVSINDVCPNTEITFKAASTYTMSYSWSDAVNNNVPYTVSSTKTYYVTGTDLNGCKTSSSINVIVKPFPSITAIASKPTLCQGEKLTLNGQGGLTYDWNNNVTDNISFTPSQTNWYYVTGTDVDGCKNTDSVELIVNSLPTVTASASIDTVLIGSPTSLIGHGAEKYIWDNGISNNLTFSPKVTQIYTVTGTDLNGCVSTATAIVTVIDSVQILTLSPGSLSSKLSKKERNCVSNLTLFGYIDARDFKTMRDSMPNLRYIDLSGSTVLNYQGEYGTDQGFATYNANAIPKNAFLQKPTIDTVLLPKATSVIGYEAFSECSALQYVTLPNSLVGIDNYALQKTSLSSVKFPNTCINLGEGVLNNCTKLQSVELPTGLTKIPTFLCSACDNLTSVNIPNTVAIIDNNAFENCGKLQSINIPSSVTAINDKAFYTCYALKNVTFNSSSSLQYIGSNAFSYCSVLQTIDIPKTVTSIGNMAFFNCYSLSTINVFTPKPIYLLQTSGVFNNVFVSNCTLNIPFGTTSQYDTASVWKNFIIKEVPKPEKAVYISAGSLTTELSSIEKQTLIKLTISGTIDAQDFKTMRDSMPKLQEVDINQAQIVEYSGSNGTGTGSVNYLANQVPIQAFVSKSILNYVVLPFSVNSIANAAFENCSNLSYVDYPSTITSIGAEAFYGTKLFEIFKPSSVSIINQATFKNCTELSMVSISSTVTTINSEAFANCSALKTIHVYAKVPPVLVSDAFSGVDKTTCKVYVPVGTLSAYKADAKWKTFFSIEEFDQSFAPYLINSTIPDQNAMNGAMFYPLDFKMYIGDNFTSYNKLKFTFESNPFIGLTSMNGMYFPKQIDSSWTGSTKIKCTVTNEANLSLDFDIHFVQNNLLIPFVSTKPTCSFSASKLYLKMNQSTKFYSQNKDALNIEWTFEGGTPATSSSVSPTVTYDTTGVFSVTLKAVNTFGEAIVNKKSYIYVSALSIGDTTICNGDSVSISVFGSGYTSYTWNTIPVQTTSTIKVSPKTATKYKVTMKKGLVSIIDSVTISTAKKPELGNDTTFCEGSSIQITPGTFAKYYWNDATVEGNASLLVSKSGSYTVTTIDALGCVASDLILVKTLYSKPTVNIGKDSTFCWKKKLTLDAGSYKKYIWSTGKTTQTIVADTTALYSVTVTDNHSCTNADTVAIKVIVPIIPDIAVVTLSSTNKNIVAWEPMNNKGIKQYHVWKENESSVFEIIKTINKTDSTYYIDQKSNPISISSRYALSTVDSACGNESYLSKIHKTMHLSCKYDGKKVTATWNNYEGLTISKYQIYRAETGKKLQLYATVDTKVGIETSWDDPKPIGLNSYYQVQFDLEKEITPSALKSDSGPFSVSLSNMAESELVGIDLETIGSVSIYPNPAQDKFTVSLPTETEFTVTVLDVLNQAVKRQSGIEKISVDCSDLQAGMYLLRIVSGDEVSTKSIMIVR